MCPGNSRHLLYGKRVFTQIFGDVDIDAQTLQNVIGLFLHATPINSAKFAWLAAKQNILCNGKIFAEVNFLVNRANA